MRTDEMLAVQSLHDELMERIRTLEAALKPFSDIAELVNHTPIRDGECVFRLANPAGGYFTLVRDDFRHARRALEQCERTK